MYIVLLLLLVLALFVIFKFMNTKQSKAPIPTKLSNPICVSIAGAASKICVGTENNSPVCYGGGSGGCPWSSTDPNVVCTTDQDCAKYAVGQPSNSNKYGGAVAGQCASANLTNPTGWTDIACMAGTTMAHP